MTEPRNLSPFERALLARFSGTYTTSGGEVWVRYEDAEAAIDLAQKQGLRLLGMEGFVVGESIHPSMSRIADFSGTDSCGTAYDAAKTLLIGPWAEVPDDMHEDATGPYMIDIVVGD